MSRSIAESIASLKNLQALRIISHRHELEIETMAPLLEIKNLKHLDIEAAASNSGDMVQSMLLNSALTLRSLVIKTNPYVKSFMQNWEQKISAHDELSKQKHTLAALKSFNLSGSLIDADFVQGLQRAIDFIKLRELNVGSLREGRDVLFQHLTSLMTSARDSGTSIGLRTLSLNMSAKHFIDQNASDEQIRRSDQAQCDFLSSFNTLTTLNVQNYGFYPDSSPINPGLLDALARGILNHSNLKSLNISCTGMSSGRAFPLVPATTVGAIIDGLPELEHLELAIYPLEVVSLSTVLTSTLRRMLTGIRRIKLEVLCPVPKT